MSDLFLTLERTQYSDISTRGGEEEEGVRSTCRPPPALPGPQSCCSMGLPHGEELRLLDGNKGILVRPEGATGAGRTSRRTGHQGTSTAPLSQPAERRQDSLFDGPQNLSIRFLPPRDSLVIDGRETKPRRAVLLATWGRFKGQKLPTACRWM